MNAAVQPIELERLTPTAFAASLDVYAPLLARLAAADRHMTAVALAQRCEAGAMQFWLVQRCGVALGCWVTEIVDTRKGRVATIALAGRRFRDWAHLRFDIYEWARDQGCVRAQTLGRRGFVRLIPEMRETRRLFEVPLWAS